MEIDISNSSERQRDPAAVELLRKLRATLLSKNISAARLAARNLSWMQEDGLIILKEALFGDYPGPAKKAAAYGLRSMKGRMTKMALEVMEQGLKHSDRNTRQACTKSLMLLKGGSPGKAPQRGRPASDKRTIQDIPSKQKPGIDSPFKRK
jgi:hypothetical protein